MEQIGIVRDRERDAPRYVEEGGDLGDDERRRWTQEIYIDIADLLEKG